MIDVYKVISLCGDSGEGLLPLASEICLELEPMLKKDEYSSDGRIIALAAAMLKRRIAITGTRDDDFTSFKAGDVTVTRSAGQSITRAENELDFCRKAALPLLRDDEFFFSGVRG